MSRAKTLGTFYEFFAGAGMARAGLGKKWVCLFANDLDRKKSVSYNVNWQCGKFICSDVQDITTADLPDTPDLVWASFPCQDLSLAGIGAGLSGKRSGAFWPFWRLMTVLSNEGRSPVIILLENVCGTLTSHNGKDFISICRTLHNGGYQFGTLIVDAMLFVPQSRPRLFIIAVRNDIEIPEALINKGPDGEFHPRSLRAAYGKLPIALRKDWLWWNLDAPPARSIGFSDLMENNPDSVLLAMMDEVNLEKVRAAKQVGYRMVGAVYKRTRRDAANRKVQRAEVRFDNVAGCLRTPAGGSSRQLIIVIEECKVHSRLISSRETACLMGLPDEYILPDNYNEAYRLIGDGVVVPVVRFLAEKIFEPVLLQREIAREVAWVSSIANRTKIFEKRSRNSRKF